MTEDTISISQPLVSVLVPSFNHQAYITQCLNSIKQLSHKRLELIVSDDCSSDKTYEIAQNWLQLNGDRFERSTLIRQPFNLGVVRNCQFLFDRAEGDYLALVASDDELIDAGIAARLKALQDNEDIDAVFGNAQEISESGTVRREHHVPTDVSEKLSCSRLLTGALLKYWYLGITGPVLMLKRRAILKDGSLGVLPPDLAFEDRYIYLRLAAQSKLKYIDVVVAKYRILGSSMSRSSEFKEIGDRGILESDKKIRHLLRGVDRLFLEGNIARSESAIGKSNHLTSYLKDKILRGVNRLLWYLLLTMSRIPTLGLGK